MELSVLRQLKSAIQDPELLGMVPPVLAVGFGIIPLKATRAYVVVGHMPGVCRDCIKFLESYFDKEVVPLPLDEKVAYAAISEVYVRGRSINHDTFPDPHFILKPENESKLLNEKVEPLGPVVSSLPDGVVVFLETSYYSRMANLDHREESASEIESEDIPFKILHGVPVVRGDPVSPDTLLLERRNYVHEGVRNAHGILPVRCGAIPHVIHPSEIQVTQIDATGGLTFYVYDHLEKIPVGSQARFRMTYHFISFGRRYRRTLTLRVHAIRVFPRNAIRYTQENIPWDLEDTERWFSIET